MTEKKKAAPKKSAQPKQKTAKKGTKPTLVKKQKVVEVLPEENEINELEYKIPKRILRKTYLNMTITSLKGLFRNLF
jgi:hypothetical protein